MNRLIPIALMLSLATPTLAGPNPQLAHSVAQRLDFYGIRVDPARLTTAQASALHLLMVSERRYLKVRQKAKTILTSEEFRD